VSILHSLGGKSRLTAVYLSAMKQLNARASDVLVIEDPSHGIAAGATVWAIRDQWFGSDQSQAGRRVEHLTEVPELLGFS